MIIYNKERENIMFKRQSIILVIFMLCLSGCGLGKEKLVINDREDTIKPLVSIGD